MVVIGGSSTSIGRALSTKVVGSIVVSTGSLVAAEVVM